MTRFDLDFDRLPVDYQRAILAADDDIADLDEYRQQKLDREADHAPPPRPRTGAPTAAPATAPLTLAPARPDPPLGNRGGRDEDHPADLPPAA